MCTRCLVVFIMLSDLTQFSLYPVAVCFQCSSATGGLKDGTLQELLWLPAVCEAHVMGSYYYAFISTKSITLICPHISLCLLSLWSPTTGNILDLCLQHLD